MQRHAPFVVTLGARDFGATQPARRLDLDALGPHPHRALDRALHRAAERDTLRQLMRDAVTDQLRIELGLLDLLDVDADFLPRELRQLIAQLVYFRAPFADHDTRPAGVNRDGHLARLALDVHVGDRGVAETCLQILPDQLVFLEQLGEFVAREVAGPPLFDDAQPEPIRMCFLSHLLARFLCRLLLLGRRFLLCLRTRLLFFLHFRFGRSRWRRNRGVGAGDANLDVARPLENRCAASHRRGREALQRLPFIHHRVAHAQRIGIERRVLPLRRLLGVRHGGLQHLMDLARRPLLGEAQDRVCFRHSAVADQIDHQAHLARRLPDAALDRSSLHPLLLALGRSFAGLGRCRLGFALRRRTLGAVATEQPRRGEFAQLVAHHVLGDVDGDELVPVVHRERVSHEVRRDRAAARPRLEDLLLVPLVEGANLHHQRLLDVRTLLYATTHVGNPNSKCRIRNAKSLGEYFAFPISHFALLCCSPALATAHDEFRGPFLLVPRLLPFDLAPGIGRRTTARGLALAAAERMVHRIHGYAAHSGVASQPAALPRFTNRQQLVLRVPHFADRREALAAHHAHLRRAEPERDVVALFRNDLRARARAAAQLAAAADLQLDVVHRGAQRNLEQRHRIAGADVGTRTGDDAVAHVETLGRDDVALLAIAVMQQRDAGRPVGIVLDCRHARGNRELVAPEIDTPVLPLVAAALPAGGDVALVVAPAGSFERLEQRFLRRMSSDFGEVGDRAKPRGRRPRPKLSDGHISPRIPRWRRPRWAG